MSAFGYFLSLVFLHSHLIAQAFFRPVIEVGTRVESHAYIFRHSGIVAHAVGHDDPFLGRCVPNQFGVASPGYFQSDLVGCG